MKSVAYNPASDPYFNIDDFAVDARSVPILNAMLKDVSWVQEALENEALSGDFMAEIAISLVESHVDKRLIIAERLANHIESAVCKYLENRAYEIAAKEIHDQTEWE